MKPQLFATIGRLSLLALLSAVFAVPARSAIPDCTTTPSAIPATDPTAFVATLPNLVSVLDTATSPPTVACTFTVGTHPTNLAVSPDGTVVYVENDGDATVSPINLTTATVGTAIPLTGVTAPMSSDLVVSPDGKSVYVVSLPNPIGATTLATLNVISGSPLASGPAISVVSGTPTYVTGQGVSIVITPDGTLLYIGTEGLTYVFTTGASPALSATVNDASGGAAAINQNGTFIGTVDTNVTASAPVSAITISSNTVTTQPNLAPTTCTQGNSIAVTPAGTVAYYTCNTGIFIQAFNAASLASGTPVATVTVATSPANPQGIAITNDGVSAIVANSDGTVAVVNIPISTVSSTVAVGSALGLGGVANRPVELSVTPATQSLQTGQTPFQFTGNVQFNFKPLTWTVSCPAAPNCGSVDSTGKYTPPATISTSPLTVTVTATSTEIPVISSIYTNQSVSSTVTVTPSQLVFTAQPPATVTAGNALAPVAVSIEDAGTVVASDNSTVSITISAPGVLSGASTTSVPASSGVATFSNLVPTKAGTFTLSATDGNLTPATSSSFAVNSGAATQLVITVGGTNSITQAAGATKSLTITAEDAFGNTDPTYTGLKLLTFSGAHPSPGPVVTSPTVTNTTGGAVAFGSPTAITFTNGVATVSGGNNGVMTLDDAETAVVGVTDGTLSSSGTGNLTDVVNADPATKLAITVGGTNSITQAAGAAKNLTITATDSFGNIDTTYSGGKTLIFTGAHASPGPVVTSPTVTSNAGAAVIFGSTTAITFTNGVATVSGGSNGVMTLDDAETAVASVTDGILSSSGPGNLTDIVSADPATKLAITSGGSNLLTQIAGTAKNLVITATDSFGNTDLTYAGPKNLNFSGAHPSPNPATSPTVASTTGSAVPFGSTTAITFTNGVATVSGGSNGVMTLDDAETAVVSVTDSTISSSGPGNLTDIVSAAATSKLVVTVGGTNSITQAAGTTKSLTITAEDSFGNTGLTYTGAMSLIFSGAHASSNPATSPTVTSNTGVAVAFGSPTAITFTNGVATVSGNNNGVMMLDDVETAVVGVTDGTISSSATGNLTDVVNADPATKLAITVGGTNSITQTAGTTRNLTITAEDSFGNTDTTYTGPKNLIFSGVHPSPNPATSPTVTSNTGAAVVFGAPTATTFTNGVATVSGNNNGVMTVYGVETALVIVTDTTLTSSGTGNLTDVVNAAAASRLVVTVGGSNSITEIAGTTKNLTVTAEDSFGNTDTTYTGVKILTFSGAHPSPGPVITNPTVTSNIGTAVAFGSPTATTFSNGVATVSGNNNGAMTLYGVETALVIVTDTTLTSSGTDRLGDVVGPAAASTQLFTTQPPATSALGVGAPVALAPAVVVTLYDPYGNVATTSTPTVTIGSTYLSTPANVNAKVGGTTTGTPVNGVATFNNLQFIIAGMYSLTATSPGLTSATSSTVTLTTSITVTVTPPANSIVILDQPYTFTLMVTGDVGNQGLTLGPLTCGNAATCGVLGTLGAPTALVPPVAGSYTQPVVYTAPASPLPAAGATAPTATFTATSITDPTKASSAASAKVTLEADQLVVPSGTTLLVASGASSGTATLTLLGPNSTLSAASFLVTTCQITNVLPAGTTLSSTSCGATSTVLNAANGQNSISLNFSFIRATNTAPRGPAPSLPLTFRDLPALAALFVFGVIAFLFNRFAERIHSRARGAIAFAVLLCLVAGWVSACAQFPVPGALPNPGQGNKLGSAVTGVLNVAVTPAGFPATPPTGSYPAATLTVQVPFQINP